MTRPDFKNWLEQRKNVVVGDICSSFNNPLSNYIKNRLNVEIAYIHKYKIYIKCKKQSTIPVRQWMLNFEEKIYDDRFLKCKVEGRTCLRILRSVKRG